MVKKLEKDKSYEIIYRIFFFEFQHISRRFMFYGNQNEAIKEFNKIGNKIKSPYGGRILEYDPFANKMSVFKRM